jgi:hypothetical protein
MMCTFYYKVKYRRLCVCRCHSSAASAYSNRACENVPVCSVTDPLTFCLFHGTVGDRLCGLVVRVIGYRSGGLGSIPGTTREKKSWVWNGVHSTS